MARFQRFSQKKESVSLLNPPSPELISRDRSCLESLMRYCCPCCYSSEEPASKVTNMNGNGLLENVNNSSGRNASSDDHPTDIVNHALPVDADPPVSYNQIPQTGFAMPKGKHKSRNGDDKAAESSTGSPTPGSDQEQAPAEATQMSEKENEDKHPSSHDGPIDSGDELKPSDTRKMHGKGYDYDNSLVSPQPTKEDQTIEKGKEDKLRASSHVSVKHKGELMKPIDRERPGGKGYVNDDSLVSPQATKEDHMIEKDRENKYPSTHGSVKPKAGDPKAGELKPIDRGRLSGKGSDYDDSLVSVQATKEDHMIEKDRENKYPSTHGSVKPKAGDPKAGELKPIDRGRLSGKGYDYDDSLVSVQATKEDHIIEKDRENKHPSTHGSVKPKAGELKPIDRGRLGSNSLVSPQAAKNAMNSKQEAESQHISPQATKDARNSKQQIEKHQEVTRSMKGKHHLADGDLQDGTSKGSPPNKTNKIAPRTDRFGLLHLERLDEQG